MPDSRPDPTALPPKSPPKSTEASSQALAPIEAASEPDPKPGLWRSQRENLITIVLAILLTVGIRTFVAEARWIPSNSMLPTLEIGDRLIVEKVSYHFRDPRRGDIIVFHPPERLNFEGAYIKRVVGLPGDRIQIADGDVIINGMIIDEEYIVEPPAYSCPGSCPGVPVETGSEFVVPQGQYFVLGDNRNDSQDSHFWGFLERENIIGHTIVRFWPPDRLHYFGAVDYPELPS